MTWWYKGRKRKKNDNNNAVGALVYNNKHNSEDKEVGSGEGDHVRQQLQGQNGHMLLLEKTMAHDAERTKRLNQAGRRRRKIESFRHHLSETSGRVFVVNPTLYDF